MTTLSAGHLSYEEAAPSATAADDHSVEVSWSAPTTTDLGYGDDVTPTAVDLGYGDEVVTPTAADLGYGDEVFAPTAADLGYDEDAPAGVSARTAYGQTAPSRSLRRTGHNSGVTEAWCKQEEATAGTAAANINLGYGEASPAHNPCQSDYVTPMSTEDKEARGYQVAAARSSRGLRRMGHRASFGGGWRPDTPPTSRIPRRVTMDHHRPVLLSRPAHHTMVPRRPSLSGASLHRQQNLKSPRRVSFGGSDSINHVAKLHCNSEDKRDIWYDTQELNQIRRKLREIICHERELDEEEDCWRGLEAYVKQHEDRLSCISGQEDSCNQIILQLHKLKLTAAKESREEQTIRLGHLQLSARLLLESATREGKSQAAKDAIDALAIYMEDMDSEQVRACFPTIRDE